MISQKRIFEIIEKGQVDDHASRYCDLFLFSLIMLNLLAVCLETIDSLHAQYRTVFTLIELISVSIFSIEYVLRIWSCAAAPDGKHKGAAAKRSFRKGMAHCAFHFIQWDIPKCPVSVVIRHFQNKW